MTLIFGFPNNRGVKVSEYLIALGMLLWVDVLASGLIFTATISTSLSGVNLLRCVLSSFEAFVTVSQVQPAYKSYVNVLPAYMKAWSSRSRVSVLNPYYPLSYASSSGLVFSNMPDVVVSFPGSPPNDVLDALRSAGGRDMIIKGQVVIVLPTPSAELLRIAVQAGAIKTASAPSESVNIQSLSTLNLVRRIFSCFLKTHQYPAFSDVDHLEYNEVNWQTHSGNEKRKRDNNVEAGTSKKRVHLDESPLTPLAGEESMDQDESDTIPTSDRIIYAVPPSAIVVGWGDASELPANDGLFVRFVDETQSSEGEKIVSEVLARYFLGCLGPTAESVKEAFATIKRDLGVINSTRVGRELSHLAKCIDIGLLAQARIFPIIDNGEYIGSALLGAGFQVHAYRESYPSVSHISLINQVDKAGSHRSSLNAICEIVSESNDNEVTASVRSSTTWYDLRVALLESETNSISRDKIVALARGLRFQPRSLNISTKNIVDCLNLIANPDQEAPDWYPIHPSKLFESDRMSVIWSAFGDLAPTCSFPGGPKIDLAKSKTLPNHIGFRNVPLKDAVLDLQMIMSQKAFGGTSMNRRSGPYKDRIYKGNDAKQILSALISATGVTLGQASSGQERAVATSNELFEEGF